MAEQRWVCWGLGKPVLPEAGELQGRTSTGQAGNSDGISLGQSHSLELQPNLRASDKVKDKTTQLHL